MKLLNLTKKVHDLLQITKLYTVFDVKDDEAAAVKSSLNSSLGPGRHSRRPARLIPSKIS